VSDRVVVVVKRTAYRLFVEEEQDERIARLLKKNDPTVRKMRRSHHEHEGTIEEVDRALRKLGVEGVWVRRAHAPFDVDDAALVVTVGGDGTLLAASHRVGTTPILGVNSAPSHSVGFFCGVKKGNVRTALAQALSGKMKAVQLSRLSVIRNGVPVSTRVLNDALFCHRSPAATTRYILKLGKVVEEQKSSGFWIGPAAGSTAAQRSAGGKILPLASTDLQLVVREPYTPEGEKLKLVRELVSKNAELFVRSKTREGRLFIDGPHEFTEIEMGDRLVFRRSPESLTVLGLSARRRWGVVPAKK
jgi:NAD+ kinase